MGSTCNPLPGARIALGLSPLSVPGANGLIQEGDLGYHSEVANLLSRG